MSPCRGASSSRFHDSDRRNVTYAIMGTEDPGQRVGATGAGMVPISNDFVPAAYPPPGSLNFSTTPASVTPVAGSVDHVDTGSLPSSRKLGT